MIIREQMTRGKAGEETCEDLVVATADYVAVIDGSTSKSRWQLHPKKSNGQWAAELVRQYVVSMPKDLDLTLFCRLITAWFQFAYQKLGVSIDELRDHPQDRPAASAAIYSRHRNEVWLVGDCQCMIDGQTFSNPKATERPIAEMRSAFIRLQLLQGHQVKEFQEEDAGRQFVLPFIIEAQKRQNIDYAVIDGFPIPISHVKVIALNGLTTKPLHTQETTGLQNAEAEHEIVLATDGYPQLMPTLKESEQKLETCLVSDPLCINPENPATKGVMRGQGSFDDRAYIRFNTTFNLQ